MLHAILCNQEKVKRKKTTYDIGEIGDRKFWLTAGIQETVVTAVGIISVYCTSPPHVENARHNALPEQTTFDLNTTLQYQCYRGYVTSGFSTAKCLELVGSSASWFGPDVSCKREYIQQYCILASYFVQTFIQVSVSTIWLHRKYLYNFYVTTYFGRYFWPP
jgi:hypothetical protein